MLHPGLRLRSGRYRLLSRLRTSPTTEIWRALDVRGGVEVALKGVALEAGGADAVEHEAEAVARVRHPGAIRVDATFEEAGHGWIAMELAAGSLWDRVEALGPLDGSTARGVALAVAEVLAAAHAVGVVHRDVKPQNVLLLGDGSVRLADFGIARVHARGHTRTGALLGTLPFMAPEQRRDPREVAPATDVYALGAMLAWMRTGVLPGDLFVPEVADALRGRLRAAGEGDDALQVLIVACGTYLPEGRVRDGAALAQRLHEVGAREDVRVGEVGALWEDARGGGEGFIVSKEDSWGGEGHAPPRNAPPLVSGNRAWEVMAAVFGVGLVSAAVAWGVVAMRPTAEAANREDGDGTMGSNTTRSGENAIPACPDAVGEWLEDVRMGPRETTAATLADVDQDGSLDALFTNQYDESVSIWWGRKGAMPEAERLDVPIGRSQWAVAVGDVDGDGVNDLVAGLQDDAAFGIVRGLGGRRFAKPTREFQSPPPQQVALVDEDGDGRLDLVFQENGGVNVRRREGDAWAPHRPVRMGDGTARTLAGIARVGAGGPELLLHAATGLTRRTLGGRETTLAGDFAAWLPGPTQLSAPPPGGARAGDGFAYASAKDGRVLRVGEAGVECAVSPAWRGWAIAAVGDLDGDKKMDAVAVDSCRMCTSNHAFLRGVGGGR